MVNTCCLVKKSMVQESWNKIDLFAKSCFFSNPSQCGGQSSTMSYVPVRLAVSLYEGPHVPLRMSPWRDIFSQSEVQCVCVTFSQSVRRAAELQRARRFNSSLRSPLSHLLAVRLWRFRPSVVPALMEQDNLMGGHNTCLQYFKSWWNKTPKYEWSSLHQASEWSKTV